MLRDDSPLNSLRAVPFEEFEERLALSAQSLTALFGSAHNRLEAVSLEPSHADVWMQANAGAAWSDVSYVRNNYGLNGAGQTVAVIDSGIAYDHPALGGGYGAGGRVVGGWDFAENDADPYDDAPKGFHGTHVAGIVGANSPTHPGLASGVDLVALRVFDDSGNGQFLWIEQALQWVAQHRNDFRNPITTVNLSVGINWNADTVPVWANLEDEFAALKNAGVVITVSAGNFFTSYNAPGVSYPAVSPYVIAAASVDANGNLSSFSQRSQKVLAAPGQSIVSTVPDSLYSRDGVTNDYASATGTSTAAPYIAGASVLVRQAMQRAGYLTINQDSIYDVLRSTADSVYDPITKASYVRVNLRRAIDTVSATTPSNWGTVDFVSMTGRQATGDRSYTVTASRTGIFTAEAIFNQAGGNVDLEIRDANNQLLGRSATGGNNERVDVNVTAGQQLFVRVIGVNANVMYRCTNLVSTSGNTVNVAGSDQDDLFVFLPGQGSGVARIAVNGVGYDFATSVYRNFNVQGGSGTDSAVVVGTWQNETATLSATSTSVSGSTYSFTATGIENVSVSAGGGYDTATLRDSADNDTFVASPTQASLSGAGYSLTASGFDVANGALVNGGYDQAFLYGSIGDDRFEASSSVATLEGAGYRVGTWGYDTVVAVGGYGNDVATLADTAGNETFIGDPDAGSLSGNGFYLRAANFERVEARSTGGYDTAYLWDSYGDDAFGGSKVLAYLNGVGFSNFVQGFDRVAAFSRGGVDTAGLYRIGNGDQLTVTNTTQRVQATDYVVETNDFSRVTSYGFEPVAAAAQVGKQSSSEAQVVDYLFTQVGA